MAVLPHILVSLAMGFGSQSSNSLGCDVDGDRLLRQAGVSPVLLAAIGATDGDIATITGFARAVCEAQSTSILNEAAERQRLAPAIQSLADKVRSGNATPEDRARLAGIRASLAALDDLAAGRSDLILSGVLSALTAEQQEQVRSAVNTKVEVPLEYRLSGRSDADLLAVRDRGEPPMDSGDAAAMTATILLAARRHDAYQAWRSGLGQ